MFKYALLGMLAKQPQHGYDLKSRFEDALGGTWPLNIGQVYTTLARLERDGFVEAETVPQNRAPDRRVYALTRSGAAELDRWLAEPMGDSVALKDEVFVKALVCAFVPGSDPLGTVRLQRAASMRLLADLDAMRADSGSEMTALLLEGAMLHVEADLRWLELWEHQVRRHGGSPEV
jgi:DNA-binding PadR family transcriptional regulator